MIKQIDFFDKYRIDSELFDETGLLWDDLTVIYDDHIKNIEILDDTANFISERLRKTQGVHSVKQRIKDPEHLIEKIIRKKIDDVERDITSKNYKTEITDLIGIRVLHLFKSDWLDIHDTIVNTWTLKEKPTANLRDGDSLEIISFFEDKDCAIKRHPFGYRSVHYLVKSNPTLEEYISEVQVRTIFEEGWSEIDHHIRYPNHTDDRILSQFLVMFNRLAGSADEMGSYIQFLKNTLNERETSHQNEIDDKAAVIDKLKNEINNLKIDSKKKQELQTDIDSIYSYTKSLKKLPSLKKLSSLQKLPSLPKRSTIQNTIGQQANILNSNWSEHHVNMARGLNDIISDLILEYKKKGFLIFQGFWQKNDGFDGDKSDLKPGNVLSVKIADVGSRESVFVIYDKKGIPVGMLPANYNLSLNDFMATIIRIFKSHEFKIRITSLDRASKLSDRLYFRCKTV